MEFKSQAFKVLSNSHAMEIMINETFEEVTYKYSDDYDTDEIATVSISYDQEGDPYFIEHRDCQDPTVHYLKDFMRMTM